MNFDRLITVYPTWGISGTISVLPVSIYGWVAGVGPWWGWMLLLLAVPGSAWVATKLGYRTSLMRRRQDMYRESAAIVARYERTFGPDHPETVMARTYLTPHLVPVRSDPVADQESFLADTERKLGPEHPDTLAARGQLANLFLVVGRLPEAIALLEQVVDARGRVLDPDDPDTLVSRNNLALAYAEAGRLREAVALLEENLSASERILGADHPQTRVARDSVAGATEELRNAPGAAGD